VGLMEGPVAVLVAELVVLDATDVVVVAAVAPDELLKLGETPLSPS
jgi:hypothetical protein